LPENTAEIEVVVRNWRRSWGVILAVEMIIERSFCHLRREADLIDTDPRITPFV